MVKNLKRYRKQVERDHGKQEAQKYPRVLVDRQTKTDRCVHCPVGLPMYTAVIYQLLPRVLYFNFCIYFFLSNACVSIFTARCYAERGYAKTDRLSVRHSVTLFRYRDHIRWNTSKVSSRPNSLRLLLGLTPTWAIWCNGNTHKIGVK